MVNGGAGSGVRTGTKHTHPGILGWLNDIHCVFIDLEEKGLEMVLEECRPLCLGTIFLKKITAFKLISCQRGDRRCFGIKWNTITWWLLMGLLSRCYIHPWKVTTNEITLESLKRSAYGCLILQLRCNEFGSMIQYLPNKRCNGYKCEHVPFGSKHRP